LAELKIRKIDFRFDDSIPFHWNPANPCWGNLVNFITLIAPAFERYAIRATRDGMPEIESAAVRKDAELFCRQEAQHARHHIAHLSWLMRRHPGLEDVRDAINGSYEALAQRESLAFHLTYVATIELCFASLAKFIIDNRRVLFEGADPRIASFILWHLVEEFEHRNSAFDIYRDVVGSHLYRLKILPAVARHLSEIETIAREGFNRHVPADISGVEAGDVKAAFADIPRRHRWGLIYRLACTLLPYHHPDSLAQPEWASQWFADEARGVDMTAYYPTGLE
jgi:predicted metal-dependent hydrolase